MHWYQSLFVCHYFQLCQARKYNLDLFLILSELNCKQIELIYIMPIKISIFWLSIEVMV